MGVEDLNTALLYVSIVICSTSINAKPSSILLCLQVLSILSCLQRLTHSLTLSRCSKRLVTSHVTPLDQKLRQWWSHGRGSVTFKRIRPSGRSSAAAQKVYRLCTHTRTMLQQYSIVRATYIANFSHHKLGSGHKECSETQRCALVGYIFPE